MSGCRDMKNKQDNNTIDWKAARKATVALLGVIVTGAGVVYVLFSYPIVSLIIAIVLAVIMVTLSTVICIWDVFYEKWKM